MSQLALHNRFILTLDGLSAESLSVLSVKGYELLDVPWRYEITFTCPDKNIDIVAVLSQPAAFSFIPPAINDMRAQISSNDKPAEKRTVYGVITGFNQLSVNKDEAHYGVMLSPRVALLANDVSCAIYQNQSVVSVVEAVLRSHGFTGVDYRLELSESYPARELITQWQESDLTFIQRLLADVGIGLRFESHAEYHCDVLVLSDSEQGLVEAGSLVCNEPSGMGGKSGFSVWDLQFTSKLVPQQVQVNDYNYREAQASYIGSANANPKDGTTHGTDYRYGEHYKTKGDSSQVESGDWYATIRHQRHLTEKLIIRGKCNDYTLAPGQRIVIDNSPLNDISEGIIILSTDSYGDRSTAYEISFTAIPYDVFKPYRPALREWPQIRGTLPAHVTSPSNDTYGYLDTAGRYRVKFNFDLKSGKKGEESLWVRLAKPYAGDRYGFHFPLIAGTGVAIAFTDGNPDRPYIAHGLHDSNHPDLVTTVNKHRNVIRTPANNKLRMDDKQGEEHIKLATEYGKTQLNMGHLVDQSKEQRGQGFELRTDEWGAIAANKGLYLTAQSEANTQGQQLDMQSAITQLENALSLAKSLQKVANDANAHPADIDSQSELKEALTALSQEGILTYAPQGIAFASDKTIQLSPSHTLTMTSKGNTDISANKNITLAAGDAISLLANQSGIKLLANQGKFEIQAQNDELDIGAKQDVKIDGLENIDLSAAKEITLICGGSSVKISEDGVKFNTSGNLTLKCAALQKMSAATLSRPSPELPCAATEYAIIFHFTDEKGRVYANKEYIAQLPDGKEIQGVTNKEGKTQIFYTEEPDSIEVHLLNLI